MQKIELKVTECCSDYHTWKLQIIIDLEEKEQPAHRAREQYGLQVLEKFDGNPYLGIVQSENKVSGYLREKT